MPGGLVEAEETGLVPGGLVEAEETGRVPGGLVEAEETGLVPGGPDEVDGTGLSGSLVVAAGVEIIPTKAILLNPTIHKNKKNF